MPTFGSLFSGIGGLDLGLERAGWECRWQVEIDPWCRKVLAKHWPDVARYGDVGEVGENLERVDLIAGGFPCQPVSWAGHGRVQADERWLWPDFMRLIRLLRPRYVLVENVSALLVRGFGDVVTDLAEGGYDTEWDCIRASEVGAHHERERVYLLAYPNSGNGTPRVGAITDGARPIFAGRNPERFSVGLQAAVDTPRENDGLPSRIYRPRGEGLGNAVVPQVAEYIGKQLLEEVITKGRPEDRPL